MHSTSLCGCPSPLRHPVIWPKWALFPQLYSCSCRSSLFKLLHSFWSLLGVGFFLSCQCFLKFPDTLQRSSLVSAFQFCPPYVFCPFYSFYETVTRNLLWTCYSNQVGPQYLSPQKHIFLAFSGLVHENFSHKMHLFQISYCHVHCSFKPGHTRA